MTTPTELVKQFNTAFSEKNETAVRAILHPNYTASCSMSKVNGPEEAIAMLKECPFDCHNENSIFVTEGNSVAHFFDWVVEAPFRGRYRVAQYVTLKDGKVLSAEMFYDTGALPKEVQEQMAQMKQQKQAALV